MLDYLVELAVSSKHHYPLYDWQFHAIISIQDK